MTAKKTQRYSISVSSRTYDRLRTAVAGSLAGFVEDLVETALDDSAMLESIVAKCPLRREANT